MTNFASLDVFGQVGNVYLNHYQPRVNGNIIQCNTIIQLEDQRLLFGYNYGIKMYDGVRWMDINTPGSVFSLAYSKEGEVYIGGRGYFGLLKKGNDGIFRFKSLSKGMKNVDDIQQVLISGSKIYFRSKTQIYTLKIANPTVNTIQKNKKQVFLSSLFSVKKRVFIHSKQGSFYEIQGNKLKKITFNKKLNNQIIKVAFEFDAQRSMIGTNEGKLYLFDGQSLQNFKIASQAYIKSNVLVTGLSISKTTFALGTLSGGCLVIKKKGGNTSEVINYQTNLPDDEIRAMGKDNMGNLWVAHQRGISKANLNLPVNVYSAYAGIEGKISTVFISKNHAYVGTSQGLFYLTKVGENEEIQSYIKKNKRITTPTRTVQIIEGGKETKIGNLINRKFGKNKRSKVKVIQAPQIQEVSSTDKSQNIIYARQSIPYLYKPIQDIRDKIRQIISFDGGLLAAGNLGLYEVVGKKAKKIITEQYIYTIVASKKSKNTFYIGSNKGLFTVKKKGNQWQVQNTSIKNDIVYAIIEFKGSVWASTMNGVYSFDLNQEKKLVKEHFYPIHNPFGEKILLRSIKHQLYAFTIKQKHQFSKATSGFIPEKGKENAFKIIGSQEKYTWLKQNGSWKNLNDKAKQSGTIIFNLFEKVEDIFLDKQGYFWIISNGQLFKVNSQAKVKQPKSLPAFLSYIKDAGMGYLDLERFNISYQKKGFKLNFYQSFPFYLSEKNTVFQYKLKGLNQQWSEWTNNPVISFNFLPAGNYELAVRSKNVFEQVSTTANYRFTISPPFWETWWFYLLQTFVLGFLVFATYYYNRADKNYRVSHILTLVTIITVFEFLFLMVEPSVDEFSGGIPVFKLLMNILLAIFINPIERYVHKYLRTQKSKLNHKDNLTNQKDSNL